jgi:hypothetical protein
VRDTLTWIGVAVAAAVVAWLGWRAVRRRPAAPTTGPRPGEIWWADVPYEDGKGHKVRPCLVLRASGNRVDVLKITSQDQRHRRDHVEIPTRAWDPKATHNSFLDLSDPPRIPRTAFQRRAGTVDAATWRLVRQHHRVSH